MAAMTMTRQALRGFSPRVVAINSHRRSSNAAFSTSRLLLNSNKNGNMVNNPSGNPEMPSFSLKTLSPNPRMRYLIIGLLLAAGAAEGASWVYFWPRFFGEKKDVEGSS